MGRLSVSESGTGIIWGICTKCLTQKSPPSELGKWKTADIKWNKDRRNFKKKKLAVMAQHNSKSLF